MCPEPSPAAPPGQSSALVGSSECHRPDFAGLKIALAFVLQVLLLHLFLTRRPVGYAAACKAASSAAEHPMPYDVAGQTACNCALDATCSLRRPDGHAGRESGNKGGRDKEGSHADVLPNRLASFEVGTGFEAGLFTE